MVNGQADVRIPPRRLRPVFELCIATVCIVLALPVTVAMMRALAGGQVRHYLPWSPLLLALLLAGVVTISFCLVWGGWALLRLVTNLPAVILTPRGIINHSIVYDVVLPWEEIESFTQFQPDTQGYKMNFILVHLRDRDRVCAEQQPLTRLLLRVFEALSPTNISTEGTKESREAVWRELQNYARTTPSGDRIKFVTI